MNQRDHFWLIPIRVGVNRPGIAVIDDEVCGGWESLTERVDQMVECGQFGLLRGDELLQPCGIQRTVLAAAF